MYKYIYNPKTGRKSRTTSNNGKKVLLKYIKQIGGDINHIAKGSYGDVFSGVKCDSSISESGLYKLNEHRHIIINKSKLVPSDIVEDSVIKIFLPESLHRPYENETVLKKEYKIFKKINDIPGFVHHESIYTRLPKKCINITGSDKKIALEYPNFGIDLDRIKVTGDIDRPRESSYVEVCKNFIDVARGLQNLSNHGYIHRDIKTTNIMINLETKKLTVIDLGLAIKEEDMLNDDDGISTNIYEYWYPLYTYLSYNREVEHIDNMWKGFDIYGLCVTMYNIFLSYLSDNPHKIPPYSSELEERINNVDNSIPYKNFLLELMDFIHYHSMTMDENDSNKILQTIKSM